VKKTNLKIAIIAVGVSTLFSCKKPENLAGTFNGESAKMGNGTVNSWVTADNFGKPKAIGFTLNAAALAGLDTSGSGHASGSHNIIELNMPEETFRVVFNQIVINWNPKGHIPIGVYNVPHFDFHFYSGSYAERKAIPVYEADSLKFKNLPSADYFPAKYFNPGGGDPEMGTHSISMDAGEINGKAFDETFVYGSYNGKINFIEPMITLSYFKSMVNFSRSIPRPNKVAVSGYYPKTLRVKMDGENYTLSLEDMEYRSAE
jgi:hypothetical protein